MRAARAQPRRTSPATESELGEYAWCNQNSDGQTHPVGRKKPNAWGLYDMHGNVWEWCSDGYGTYPTGHVTDPAGAPSSSSRVLRGGSWYNSPFCARSAYRLRAGTEDGWGRFGLRCAATAAE